MEILENNIIINDNYSGLLVFDRNLEQIARIKLFDEMIIHSSFKQNEKILLFCPDNHCFVFVDLKSNKKLIIPLKQFKNWIFSPLYFWDQSNVILSDYRGHFVNLDLIRCKITIIDINGIDYKLQKNIVGMAVFQMFKVYNNEKRAIVFHEKSCIRLIDFKQDIKVIKEFEKERYYDFEWVDEYILKTSEKNLELVHNNENRSYNPGEEYNYLIGKILITEEGEYLYLLSTLTSDNKVNKIEKIELRKSGHL